MTTEFEKGARAATEAMTRYFRNENEVIVFPQLNEEMLTQFVEGAVQDALSHMKPDLSAKYPEEQKMLIRNDETGEYSGVVTFQAIDRQRLFFVMQETRLYVELVNEMAEYLAKKAADEQKDQP